MMLAAFAPLLGACDESSSAVSAAQPTEPDVSIVTVKPQARAVVRELPGRIAPTRVAEVRPRVSGIVVERLFRQGSEVKAGDPLYRIDPRPFEVEVMANEAALAKADAALMQAQQQARRIATLTSQRACLQYFLKSNYIKKENKLSKNADEGVKNPQKALAIKQMSKLNGINWQCHVKGFHVNSLQIPQKSLPDLECI